jgi:hypothetical protein
VPSTRHGVRRRSASFVLDVSTNSPSRAVS